MGGNVPLSPSLKGAAMYLAINALRHILNNPDIPNDPAYRAQIEAIVGHVDAMEPDDIALTAARMMSPTGDAVDSDPDGAWRACIAKAIRIAERRSVNTIFRVA